MTLLLLIGLLTQFVFDRLNSDDRREFLVELTTPLPDDVLKRENIALTAAVEKVKVTGFFSDWDIDGDYYALTQVAPNHWQIKLKLTPGTNQYKLVVFFKDITEPVWIVDANNPRKVQDSYGHYNSVANIPDIPAMRQLAMFIIYAVAFFLLAYYLLEPALRWILRQKLPLNIKLALGLTFVVSLSNLVFILYHFHEARQIIKQGIIDNVHIVHLVLKGDGIDFSNLPAEQDALYASIDKFFWGATIRVEKTRTLPSQITLSDFAVFDKHLNLLTLNHRQQNLELQENRAQNYGFVSTRDHFLNGVMAPAIAESQKLGHSRKTLFMNPISELNQFETPKTRIGRFFLGFSNFLHPIIDHGQLLGYYGGNIQVKLFGEDLKRILYLNLLLLLFLSILTYFLLTNIGNVLTRYISELVEVTRRIVSGDFSHKVEINSQDELQLLGENFAKMGFVLEQSFNQIEEKNRLLEIEAYTDELTQLPNRKKLFADLEKQPATSLILFNIDSFKSLNDFFGYESGDSILAETAKRISLAMNNKEFLLYHIGADEFVVTLAADRHEEEIVQLVNVVCDLVAVRPYQTSQNEIHISLTAGVVIGDPRIPHQKSLHGRAEKALLQAKTELARFRVYEQSMEAVQAFERNMSWANRIRRAIDDDKIIPYFQAIQNNKTNQIEKYECLVRIIEEEGRVASPGAFLSISKNARLYPFITQIMLRKSFETFKDLPYEFTINLSIEDILDTRTYQNIIHMLKVNPTIAKRLTFEIVETAEIKSYDIVRSFINEIKPSQCKIAIDDFGSGYSNFAHILSLNIDYIKIDGSLIRNLDHDSNTQTITQTICDFAKKMGVETIAEFVHSEAIYDKCVEYGITHSQGFYIGEPVAEIDQS